MSTLVARADRLAHAGEYARAHELYERATALHQPGAHERLCHTEALLGRTEAALLCTTAALALSPASVFLHMLDGQEALTMGRAQRAATSYERAISLSPAPDADLLVNAGIALLASSRSAEAVERLRASTALAPQSAAAYTELARALEASVAAGDAACSARAHAARLSPTSSAHQLDLGTTLLAAQRVAEAMEAMQSALRLAPASSSFRALAYFGLGRAELTRGDGCRARRQFEHSTSLVPSDAEAWHQRGVAAQRCLWTMGGAEEREGGMMAEAKRAWRAAIAIEPRGTQSLTLLRLTPPAPPPTSPATSAMRMDTEQWSVGAGGTAAVLQPAADADSVTVAVTDVLGEAGSGWIARALGVLERTGALRLSDALPASLAVQLAGAFEQHSSASQSDEGSYGTEPSQSGDGSSTYDTSNSTLAKENRRHVAISLRTPALIRALDALAPVVMPLLCRVLCPAGNVGSDAEGAAPADGQGEAPLPGCSCSSLRVVESGLLTSWPGAREQPLHTDTSSHVRHEARALKLQLGVTDITRDMGPIEVVPGSIHSPPDNAESAITLPLPLPLGSALVYDSRVWHRGGSNLSRQPRPVYYVTVVGEGAPPAGLPYTMEPEEIGCFRLMRRGVVQQRTRRCRARLRGH